MAAASSLRSQLTSDTTSCGLINLPSGGVFGGELSPSGLPLNYRVVSQVIDNERLFFGVFSDTHLDADKLARVALTRGMKKSLS